MKRKRNPLKTLLKSFERRRQWKASDIRVLRRLYPNTKTAVIARKLKRTLSATHQAARRLGLSKSREFKRREALKKLAKAGKAYRFKPGHTTWNKGTHWVAGGRSAETRFKKGQMPPRHRPVGSERLTREGDTQVKVAEPDVWKLRKEIVWEQTYGPVPKGMVLRCKDGNRQNTLLKNLELITRARNMELNSFHRYPRELKTAIRLNKRLQREIERHEERH